MQDPSLFGRGRKHGRENLLLAAAPPLAPPTATTLITSITSSELSPGSIDFSVQMCQMECGTWAWAWTWTIYSLGSVGIGSMLENYLCLSSAGVRCLEKEESSNRTIQLTQHGESCRRLGMFHHRCPRRHLGRSMSMSLGRPERRRRLPLPADCFRTCLWPIYRIVCRMQGVIGSTFKFWLERVGTGLRIGAS